MKWAILVVLALFLVSGSVTHAAFVEQYRVSPLLKPGMYVYYTILFHPSVNFANISILAIPTNTTILVNVTLTTITHAKPSFLQLITVKGDTDANHPQSVLIKSGNKTSVTSLVPSTDISIPKYQFYVSLPIVSSYLNALDNVNLDERKVLGIQVQGIGGDVQKFAFRQVYQAAIQTQATIKVWEWDKATGFVIIYRNSNNYPYVMDLLSTNAWDTPYGNVYKPLSIQLLISDIYLMLASVGGFYFSFWWLWAISFALILSFALKGWAMGYLTDRKRQLAHPNLKHLLSKIHSQDKKVLFLTEENA